MFTLSDCWSWACTYKAELGPDSRVSRDRPLIHRHIARRINTSIFVHLQPATFLQIVLFGARPSFYPIRRCLSHHFTDYDFRKLPALLALYTLRSAPSHRQRCTRSGHAILCCGIIGHTSAANVRLSGSLAVVDTELLSVEFSNMVQHFPPQGGSRKISFNISDQYEIQDVIGEGAYGVVTSAIHKPSAQRVAIKKIIPFDHSMFCLRTLREMKLLRYFNHENIISILDIQRPRNYEGFNDVYLIQVLPLITYPARADVTRN